VLTIDKKKIVSGGFVEAFSNRGLDEAKEHLATAIILPSGDLPP